MSAARLAVAAFLLFFGRLLPLSGRLGFVIVWFAVFIVIYGLLVSITDNRPAVVDRVMAALLTAATVTAGFALLRHLPPAGGGGTELQSRSGAQPR